MKIFLQRILVVILSIGLIACVSKKAREFQDTGSVQPMLIPSGYSSAKVEDYYRIPSLPKNNQVELDKKKGLIPPGAKKH